MSSVLPGLAQRSSFPVGTAEPVRGLRIEPVEPVQITSIASLRSGVGRLEERIQSLWGMPLPRGPRLVRADAVCLLGTGPGKWLLVQPGPTRSGPTVADALSDSAAVSDLSGAFGVLRLSGSATRGLLSGGMFLDLHPSRFDSGAVAVSSLGDFTVIVWRAEDETGFYLAVPRSTAVDIWQWLHRGARQINGAPKPALAGAS